MVESALPENVNVPLGGLVVNATMKVSRVIYKSLLYKIVTPSTIIQINIIVFNYNEHSIFSC